MKTPKKTAQDQETASQPDRLATVRDQVKSVRFGLVQIVIHDSRVVQIEKTERMRLDKTNP
jgi:hypothetical protein